MMKFSFRRLRKSSRWTGDGDDQRGLVENERTKGTTAGFQITTITATLSGDIVLRLNDIDGHVTKETKTDSIDHAHIHNTRTRDPRTFKRFKSMTNKKPGSKRISRKKEYRAKMQGQGSRHSGFGYFISFDIHRCIAKLYWLRRLWFGFGGSLRIHMEGTLLHIDTSYHWKKE